MSTAEWFRQRTTNVEADLVDGCIGTIVSGYGFYHILRQSERITVANTTRAITCDLIPEIN